MNFKQPMDVNKLRLLMLLNKLKIRMTESITLNDGDAFVDLSTNFLYFVADGKIIQLSGAQ